VSALYITKAALCSHRNWPMRENLLQRRCQHRKRLQEEEETNGNERKNKEENHTWP